MKLHPPHATDGSILLRMKRIGLEAGKSFNFDSLDAELQKALMEGARVGLEQIKKLPVTRPWTFSNGWLTLTVGIGVYGNDYIGRAYIAMAGIGANQPEDAIYPLNFSDGDGKPLMGENRYVMHFDKDKLPPIDAFWSVTMYDAEGFPILNAINRYAIGDRDALHYNQDGSLLESWLCRIWLRSFFWRRPRVSSPRPGHYCCFYSFLYDPCFTICCKRRVMANC